MINRFKNMLPKKKNKEQNANQQQQVPQQGQQQRHKGPIGRKNPMPDNPNSTVRDVGEDLRRYEAENLLADSKKTSNVMDTEDTAHLKSIKKNERLGMLNYYTERLLNKMTKGSLDIQGSAFEISYSKIMSENHKKRIILIKEYPTYIYPGHLERIRLEAKKQIPRENVDKVDVNIIEHSMPHNIAFKTNKKVKSTERNFRRQLNDATTQRIKKQVSLQQGVSPLGVSRDDITILVNREARLKRKVLSYGHINRHQLLGGTTIKSYVFVEVIGATNELTDYMADIVTQLLAGNNYKFEEVTDLTEYLEHFGVASINYQKQMKDVDIQPMTVTSDISAATPTYSEGIIRSATGDVYIGNSLETGYPVFTSFSESAAASNTLVVADSGSGKTVLVKTIVLGALNHRGNTYNIVVTDYKGGEWSSLVEATKNTQEVSMGISNPKFINTLIIPDHKTYGFPHARSSFDLATSYTVKLLSTLVGVEDPMLLSQVQNICNDIVDRVYRYNGIDSRKPSTYYKSQELKFAESIWEAIDYVTSRSSDMRKRHNGELLGIVKTALEYYFTEDGSKRFMFRNSVDMDELMKAKLIVFDYGAQSAGGQASLLEKEVHANILQKNFFSTLYAAKNKLHKEYTIDVEEEVQRQLNSPLLAKELNDKITGGRSSNRSTILLTNTISGIINNKDDVNISAIKENVNTIMLGRVKADVAEMTMKYFNIEQAKSRVMDMLTGTGNYNHSFLIAFNTGKVFDMCLAKVSLPKHIIDSKMFESRDVEEYEAKSY